MTRGGEPRAEQKMPCSDRLEGPASPDDLDKIKEIS